MTRVKICGVTRIDDAVHAATADFVGLNFWPRSKRHVTVDAARALADAVRGAGLASLVGVFVDASRAEIAKACAEVALDIVQLHGGESIDDAAVIAETTGCAVWKAISVGSASDLDGLDRWPVDALLLDTPTPGRGGSGTAFDWALARAARARSPMTRLVLAGGLDPSTVARAIREVSPWAVDVASGVESAPGEKDVTKIAAFIRAAREA